MSRKSLNKGWNSSDEITLGVWPNSLILKIMALAVIQIWTQVCLQSQGSDLTERKSSVQFKSSLFWWTLNWTQFTFLLKELELNLVHLLSELEQKWTEKFSSFFYYKTKVFWCIFHQKMLLTLQFFYELKILNFFQTKNHNFQKIVL